MCFPPFNIAVKGNLRMSNTGFTLWIIKPDSHLVVFGSLRSCRKTKKTKTQSLSPLSLDPSGRL